MRPCPKCGLPRTGRSCKPCAAERGRVERAASKLAPILYSCKRCGEMRAKWQDCPTCRATRFAAYRAANAERLAAWQRAYYEAHKAAILARQRSYYAANARRIIARTKAYYKANKVRMAPWHSRYGRTYRKRRAAHLLAYHLATEAQRKAYFAAYHLRHRQRIAAKGAAHYRAHPEMYRIKSHRRRAKLRNAHGSFTDAEWEAKKKAFDNRCIDCGVRESESVILTIGHAVPLDVGGCNMIANVLPQCLSCNCKQGTSIHPSVRMATLFDKLA